MTKDSLTVAIIPIWVAIIGLLAASAVTDSTHHDRLTTLESTPPAPAPLTTLPCTLVGNHRGRMDHTILVLECPDSLRVDSIAPWAEETS